MVIRLGEIVLAGDWCGRAELTLGGVVEKLAEQKPVGKQVSGAPLFPALVPTLTSLSDDCGLETEAKQRFPPQVASGPDVCHSNRQQTVVKRIVDSSQTA